MKKMKKNEKNEKNEKNQTADPSLGAQGSPPAPGSLGSPSKSTLSSETQPSPRPELPAAKEEIPDPKILTDKKVQSKEALKTKSEL